MTEVVSLQTRVTDRYSACGQSHVLSHVDSLSPSERHDFLTQLDSIDVESLGIKFDTAMEEHRLATEGGKGDGEDEIGPLKGEVGSTRSPSDSSEVARWRSVGMDAVRGDHVACVLLAGGQGTRLGYSGPKGAYDIGMASGRTLFRLVAERILKLTRLAGPGSGRVPLYVMTSPLNDAETRSHFESNSHFGLDPEDVVFFSQGTLPCLDPEGKILLEGPSRVAEAPDGNGGIYPAMDRCGVLKDMERRGVRHVHAFAIDNALVRPADPVFIGYCIDQGADCGNKVLWKTGPHEKVGVVATRGGKPCVVEYSDLSREMAEMTDQGGRLVYGAGNICNHYYTLSFIRDVVVPNVGNMYHVARKKIPTYDFALQKTVKPTKNNGIKLESFIFDVFPLSQKMAVLDVSREEEFAPVKNAPGSDSDSPDTARKLMSELAKGWLKTAGAMLTGEVDSDGCEIGPLSSYGGEGLEEYEGKEVICPFSL